MIDLHGPRIMIGVLVLLTAGAMGIALSGLPLLRITSFDVIADDDSLRTEPLVELMEELYGLCQPITNEADITGKIASFLQVDQVFVAESVPRGHFNPHCHSKAGPENHGLDHSEPGLSGSRWIRFSISGRNMANFRRSVPAGRFRAISC